MLRSQNLFREDFYYRLCSDVIQVPPLRQRLQEYPEELTQLLAHTITGIIGEPSLELEKNVAQVIRRTVGERYAWPGNVRELEQAVRRILLTNDYAATSLPKSQDVKQQLIAGIQAETLDADALLAGYCALLYKKTGNYEAVARLANLDRRTVKKYLSQGAKPK